MEGQFTGHLKFRDGDFVKDGRGSTYRVVMSKTWGITVQNVATKVITDVFAGDLGEFVHTPPTVTSVTYYKGSEDKEWHLRYPATYCPPEPHGSIEGEGTIRHPEPKTHSIRLKYDTRVELAMALMADLDVRDEVYQRILDKEGIKS